MDMISISNLYQGEPQYCSRVKVLCAIKVAYADDKKFGK